MNLHIARFGRIVLLSMLPSLLLAPVDLRAQESDDDVLFRAMQEELERSVQRLKLEDQGKPYFVEYRVNESRGYRISGTFGGLTVSQPYHNRGLAVNIHIGDYAFDNTGFFARADLFNRFGRSGNNLVIENNLMALRRDLWLATDKAYKDAVEQMAAKRGYLESRVEKDSLPDFSQESATNLIEPMPVPKFDTALWEGNVRRWSAMLRDYPEIQESSISFTFDINGFYLTNNEGTQIRTGRLRGTVTVDMSTQSVDGISLVRSFPITFNSPEAGPTDAQMEKIIRSLAGELTTLRKAPMLEKSYIGPVLLVGDAATSLFERTLVPHLSGSSLPTIDDQSMSGFLGGESDLAKRMNLRVMPRSLSVYDNPGAESAHGKLLHGHYRVDDQGVPARKVSLIENGVVKGLLTSRRPGENFPNSNGHGRGFMESGTTIGNLFVETSEGMSYDELKAELIRYCRDLGLEYGIVLKRIGDDSESLSGGGVSVRFGSDGENVETTTAVRVYVSDGREEPLRGVSVDQMNLRTLKDIVAAGKDYAVSNTFVRPNGVAGFDMVQASIIAPSILLEEVQLNPSDIPKQKPVILTHPYFEKKKK